MNETARSPASGQRLIFRVPTTSLLGAGTLALCITPAALAAPWLLTLYVAPVGIAAWILRTRTVVETRRLVTRSLFGGRTIEWAHIASLKLSTRSWIAAVLDDDEVVPLPGIRLRHLPMLAAFSGGRLADPTAPPAEADSAE
ncbi:MAG: PH domain-containing protein [Kutzneria sp.]|nr:PH domain-containing protein [Kutzneria sp.]